MVDVNTNWKAQFAATTEETVRSGVQAIQLVSGTLEKPDREAGKSFDGKPAKDQVVLKLSNAQILRVDKGAMEPELKDDIFTLWLSYALPGQHPTKQSKFAQTIMKSAEQLWEKRGQKGKGWLDLVGTQVTMERKPWEYSISVEAPAVDGETPTGDEKPKKERKKEAVDAYFFVENADAEPEDIIGDIRDRLVVGQKKAMVLRNLTMDAVAKRYPGYKHTLTTDEAKFNETFGVLLSDEGIYVKA